MGLPSEMWMKLRMEPRKSSGVCILTAAFVLRKVARETSTDTGRWCLSLGGTSRPVQAMVLSQTVAFPRSAAAFNLSRLWEQSDSGRLRAGLRPCSGGWWAWW